MTSFDAVETPKSFTMEPVYSTFEEETKTANNIVGGLIAVVSWDEYFTHLLPDGVHGIALVLSNSCGQSYTYRLNGH